MLMARSEEISCVQSWIIIFQKWCRENQLFLELIQYCLEFIRVNLTEQDNVSGFITNHILGGRNYM